MFRSIFDHLQLQVVHDEFEFHLKLQCDRAFVITFLNVIKTEKNQNKLSLYHNKAGLTYRNIVQKFTSSLLCIGSCSKKFYFIFQKDQLFDPWSSSGIIVNSFLLSH